MHELDFSKGRAAIFSVRVTPWHEHGNVLDSPPTIAEGLEQAGLDYEVEKQETYRLVITADGISYMPNETAFVTVRTDTGAELASVGPDYQPLQNIDAFRVMEPLLDQGILSLETAGALRGGQVVWVQSKLDVTRFGPVVREVFTDEIVPYVLVRNSHDGKSAARVQLTPQRIVCLNTLGMADSRAERGLDSYLSVRHTGDVELRMAEAAEALLKGIIERYEVVATSYRALKQTYLDTAQFRTAVLDVVAPIPADLEKVQPFVLDRIEAKRGALADAWMFGSGHTGDHSAWEAYNGTVELLDHDRTLFPTRGSRVASMLDGSIAQMKSRVLTALLEVAA